MQIVPSYDIAAGYIRISLCFSTRALPWLYVTTWWPSTSEPGGRVLQTRRRGLTPAGELHIARCIRDCQAAYATGHFVCPDNPNFHPDHHCPKCRPYDETDALLDVMQPPDDTYRTNWIYTARHP